MQLKLISQERFCTFSCCQSESFWNSEKAYMLDSFSVFRVRLGYLSSFLSTSCITSLHFIPDSDEGKWYFSVIDFRLDFRRLPIPVFHHGRCSGGSLLFGIYGFVPLKRVWLSMSWVLNRVYNFTIKRLKGVFLDWKAAFQRERRLAMSSQHLQNQYFPPELQAHFPKQ